MKRFINTIQIIAVALFIVLLMPTNVYAEGEDKATDTDASLEEIEGRLDDEIVEEAEVNEHQPKYLDYLVKIVLAYQDENGNMYYVKQGTGFVIGVGAGSSEANNKKYIISDYGIVEGEKDYVDAVKTKYSLGDTKLTPKYYAVGNMGVFTELKMISYSDETRYVILEPSAGLADKNVLRLGGQKEFGEILDEGEELHWLDPKYTRVDVEGFAGKRSVYLEDGKVADGGIVVYDGIAIERTNRDTGESMDETYFNDTIEYFYVSDKISSCMAGAPVIDSETQCVIGMLIYERGDKRIRAISIENIRQVLDALAINYMVATDDVFYDTPTEDQKLELKKLIVDNKEYISSINKNFYTSTTWNALYDAIAKADNVYMSSKSTAKDYDDNIVALKKARKKLKTKAFKWKLINVIAAVVIVVVLIILMRILRKRKRLRAERKIITDMGK